MRVSKIEVKNFRLLSDVEIALEKKTTVVVGRNNSGKTSLSEVMKRFLVESNPTFQIEDFSCTSHDNFCAALKAKNDGFIDSEVRSILPFIELKIYFSYDKDQLQLGALSEFIVDLNLDCNEALIVARYELKDGAINSLFEGCPDEELTEVNRKCFFRTLRERIPVLFSTKILAQDPNDSNNIKLIQNRSAFRSLLMTDCVNAQRGLDDTTSRENDVLAKILECLFTTATSPSALEKDKVIADALVESVKSIQESIDKDFKDELKKLIPKLKTFGYPGLGGSELETETILDVKRLLSNHTKVRYTGYGGIHLPESYNGLGVRNLIFIFLQIVRFYKTFRAEESVPIVHLIFIEEPEAHLHPQMQEVFIRQLSDLAKHLNHEHPNSLPWPVQFIVSTHSSHIANEVGFEAIRYFLSTSSDNSEKVRCAKIKDLRKGLRKTSEEHLKFLHQYLTLTKCDLFFADKAILIEGTAERLLMRAFIQKMESIDPSIRKLSSQYVTVMEVGGAYAHIFFELLDFLELQCLIITDLDSTIKPGGAKCIVHKGQATSNACIKEWFDGDDCSPQNLLKKDESEKIKNKRRIAFQKSEVADGPCGRTFEDAFILANRELFSISGGTVEEQENMAREIAENKKKSEFALQYAIYETVWKTPIYILEGLRWLAEVDNLIEDIDLKLADEPLNAAVPIEVFVDG